jgi:hypothetical protein
MFHLEKWLEFEIIIKNKNFTFFNYTLSYNFLIYIMYIITHLYVVKDFWNSEILKQFWNILWIFKFEIHIF